MTTQESTAHFRGKSVENEEWVYGNLLIRKNKFYIATNDNLDFMVVGDDGKARIKLIEVHQNTVSGYTSHNDIDDIKVFVGDILECLDSFNSSLSGSDVYRNLVIYKDGSYIADGFYLLEAREFKYCRIVGNYFDNPELWENDGVIDLEEDEEDENNADGEE